MNIDKMTEQTLETRYSREAFEIIKGSLPDDPDLLRRLERAFKLVQPYSGYCFHKSQRGDFWTVDKLATSLLGEDTQYVITESEGCSCPDAQTVRAGLCKHRLGVRLIFLSQQLANANTKE